MSRPVAPEVGAGRVFGVAVGLGLVGALAAWACAGGFGGLGGAYTVF